MCRGPEEGTKLQRLGMVGGKAGGEWAGGKKRGDGEHEGAGHQGLGLCIHSEGAGEPWKVCQYQRRPM